MNSHIEPYNMIRKYQPEDLPSVLNIWLKSNLDAHSFIAATYWESHLEYMKQVLPQADIYVYEIQNQVVAFAGLENNYIAGIFVQQKKRSQGIGKQLLSFLKNIHSTLSLTVYEKNKKALKFYIREGFQVIREGIDSDNNEKEWFMQWDK